MEFKVGDSFIDQFGNIYRIDEIHDNIFYKYSFKPFDGQWYAQDTLMDLDVLKEVLETMKIVPYNKSSKILYGS